jgi:hypothetical protein
LKDAQAASVLSAAVKNSLGMASRVAEGAVVSVAPSVTLQGLTPKMAAAVQYVLDHAGPEASRFGISQEAIAEKIQAQVGLKAVADPPLPIVAGEPETKSLIQGRVRPAS